MRTCQTLALLLGWLREYNCDLGRCQCQHVYEVLVRLKFITSRTFYVSSSLQVYPLGIIVLNVAVQAATCWPPLEMSPEYCNWNAAWEPEPGLAWWAEPCSRGCGVALGKCRSGQCPPLPHSEFWCSPLCTFCHSLGLFQLSSLRAGLLLVISV